MGRFQTTMAADLERVTSRLHECDDRKLVLEKLRERKLGNTQTSVVFGFDETNYETDAMSRQKDILNKGEKTIAARAPATKEPGRVPVRRADPRRRVAATGRER